MTTMIEAKGWKASFKTDYGHMTEPLLFWLNEDGIPIGFIVNNRTGRPVSAERASNFDGYVQDEEVDAVTVAAEPGWWVVERDRDTPDRGFWVKVIAWRISHEGFGIKAIVVPDSDGSTCPQEPEQDKTQFVFDPARAPLVDGIWPTDEVPA